ncbi:galactose-1-phosphate uridylyltransferase [Planctomycetales bacterium]|nr:galactose-1-phosphate uridylyltransferase [Planctomycetales bacterium]
MPEYRHNKLTGKTVIIAEERLKRPHQFDIEDNTGGNSSAAEVCPFCPGNESETPPLVDLIDGENTWQVRAVPNKYPAVTGCEGSHEVIIDTPRHVLSISGLTENEVTDMLRMYQRRLRFYRQEKRRQFVQIFKNVGAAAGASLPHSHSQLIAMPFVPEPWRHILHCAEKYRSETQHCYWCEQLKENLNTGERIIEESPLFVALCPYVSRFAAEVEIYPKQHLSGFDNVEERELPELAGVLRRTVRRLEKIVSWMKGTLAYNVVLNTEPLTTEKKDGFPNIEKADFHWYISILPGLARAAGFEWGTGLHINPVPPEHAARKMRETE